MAKQFSLKEVLAWKQMVSKAAEYGNVEEIKMLLLKLSTRLVREILDHKNWEHHNDETPLTIAVNCGHLETVKLFINHIIADLDRTYSDGILSRSKEIALKRAACHGHFKIMEWLISKGCDVNQDSDHLGTPLSIACFQNHLDIVKYLVDNGADIDAADKHGHTCLMAACLSGGKDLVQYLLEKGADINRKSHDGQTALHEAAWKNAPHIVKLLLLHGATMSKNNEGHTPLITAALWRKHDVVDFFVESSAACRNEKIDMLELLGARMAGEDINEAFRYLLRGMVERHMDPSKIISKPHSPLLSLSGVAESQTLGELKSRQFDQDTLRLECLATIQRILGVDNEFSRQQLFNFFFGLAKVGRDSEARAFLFHGLKDASLNAEMRSLFYSHVHCFLGCFEEMLAKGDSPEFSSVENVLELTLTMMQHKGPRPSWFLQRNERLINFCLYCIILGLKVAQNQEEGKLLQKQAKYLIDLRLPIPQGRSVLHLAVACCWKRLFQIGHMPHLPYDLLVLFLLQCGADVHAMDDDKNTPLHLIAGFATVEDKLEIQCQIIHILVKAGALVGIQNSEKKTPLDVAGTEAVAALLRKHFPVTLKSLAATVVIKYQILYAGEIPKELEEFVQHH